MAELAISSGAMLTAAGALMMSSGVWGWQKVSLRLTLWGLMATQGFERAFAAAFASGGVGEESAEPRG
ncbi:MAG TPA: hypothetical protein VLS25_06460 [Dehalococcoidia bacterium]|nr:hypothetical protein [Dehalococcoidia bacterium]